MEFPTKLELVINLKSAKALDLTVPAIVLATNFGSVSSPNNGSLLRASASLAEKATCKVVS